MNFLLFLIFLTVELVEKALLDNSSLTLGEKCVALKNRPGVCKPIKECDYYLTEASDIEKKTFLRPPHLCSFTNVYDPTKYNACCPITEEKPLETPKRRSVVACESYKNKEETPFIQHFKVIDGNPAEPGEFPFFAALQIEIEGKIEFRCGGVLISRNYVLTAAHCVPSTHTVVLMRLGKTSLLDVSSDIFNKTDVRVKSIIPYPEYKPSEKYHDIALIELEEPIQNFTFNVWPACLAPEINEGVTNFQIVGFGRTNISGPSEKMSDWMMKAGVEEIPLDECLSNYTSHYKSGLRYLLPTNIEETQICAKNRTSSANTCQGDSGSGLMYKSGDRFYVYGITSFGPSCKSRIPSIYTRVSSYLKWIEDIVWPEKKET